MISRMSNINGSITLFLYKKTYTTWSFRAQDVRGTSVLRRPRWNVDSGAVPTDRRTAERRNMQVGSSVSSRYYTAYQTNSGLRK